jgi:methionyl-tRNA formyltransferase
MPRKRIIDLVRSLAPQPLARADAKDGETLKILSVRPTSGTLPPVPGQYVAIDPPRLEAQCGDGNPLVIERLIAPNRGPMTGPEYARKYLVRLGRQLGEA